MKIHFSHIASAVSLCFCLSCVAGFGASVSDLVKQGDVYDQKLTPTKALEFYLAAEKQDPDNVDLLLRIARQYRHKMADTGNTNEEIRLSGMAMGYAQRAVKLSPKNSEAQLSVAITYAKSGELYGTEEKIAALHQVKRFTDKAIALDSKNDLAWYILGRWNQKLADVGSFKRGMAAMAYGGLPKTSYAEAEKCFRKAISINSKRSPYCIDLGITCVAMGKSVEGQKWIAKGLALPSTGKDDPETKKRGQKALK